MTGPGFGHAAPHARLGAGLIGAPQGPSLFAAAYEAAADVGVQAFLDLVDNGVHPYALEWTYGDPPSSKPLPVPQPRKIRCIVRHRKAVSAHAHLAAQPLLDKASGLFQDGAMALASLLVVRLPLLQGSHASCCIHVERVAAHKGVDVGMLLYVNGVLVQNAIDVFVEQAAGLAPATDLYTCSGQKVAAGSFRDAETLVKAAAHTLDTGDLR